MKYNLFIIAILFFSCQEGTDKILDNKIEYRSPLVSSSNGILTFNSEEEFNEYYNYLDSITNISPNLDSTLQLIEDDNSFVSYRSLNYVDNLSQIQLEEYYTNELMPDVLMQSIFNTYCEYKIGNNYYVYLGPNRLYKIKDNDYTTLVSFRGIPRRDSIPPVLLYNENVEIVSGRGDILIGSAPSDTVINWRSSKVHVDFHLEPNIGCGYKFGRKLHAISIILIDGEWERLDGYWTIYWGDGSTPSLVNNVNEINIEHDYSEYLENITVKIEINYNDPDTGPEMYSFIMPWIIVGRDCRYDEYSEVDFTYAYSRCLVSKIWNNDPGGMQAWSHCWKLDGNKYVRERGELNANLKVNWYHTVFYCGSVNDVESDSEHCNNCRSLKAAKTGGCCGSWSPTDPPSSTHRLRDGGQDISDSQILNPCD